MSKTNKYMSGLIVLAALLLSACGGAAPAAGTEVMEMPAEEMMEEGAPTAMPEDEMMDMGTPTAMMEEAAGEEMMDMGTPTAMMVDSGTGSMDASSTAEPAMAEAEMMESPAWFSALLADARSGESFTINDLNGKVVLVETMAVWCSQCLKQQRQVLELHESLGEHDDFISLGLDIDPNEDAEILKAFIEKNSFHWRYAVAPAEVAREIGSLYGDQFLNPPSTPMLIIDRHGEAHPLPFGIKDAQSLLEALEPFLSDEM